ncbi:MAG TPA: prolyl oligopeptidase family serine peptidase [Albitalea sp.]|nr:prolyl oligopeptidase family serine peptidase [Albitalea sp.]
MPQTAAPADDPFLWLEDVQGDKALAWVRERNALSQKELMARPEYAPTRAQILEVLNAKDRIPFIARRGDWLYNFWQDESHKKGLWRRTTLAEYRKPEPAWETLLDLDALGKAEGENWVWKGATCYGPSYRRCLLALSRGGADAKVEREFDTVAKRFVDDGFKLPEAKSDVSWIDENTLYVATDFGLGSMTDSGYPRVIKRWKRGTPLADAATVFEGEKQDVAVGVSVDRTPGYERTVFVRSLDFFHSESFLLDADKLVRLDIPSDATLHFMRDTLLLQIRSDFKAGDTTFPAGSLLHADVASYLEGERRLRALFTPTATRSFESFAATRDHVIVNVLDNVASKLEQWRKRGSEFVFSEVKAPFPGTLGVSSLHDELIKNDPLADNYLVTYTDFLTPESLYLATAGGDSRMLLKSRKPLFDAHGMRVEQRFATSKDGTRVPYFVVWPQGAKPDANNPTLLYGYGGFEVTLNPTYSAGNGRAWLSRGGVYVLANIRGGGEFGPNWHQSALKANRQRAYDDFIAVAEDLIANKITSSEHLGIQGGSNGGLLMGVMLTQRPELFKAIVCQVPLLDMRRYNQLLAGASWMAEYGNPDRPDEWAFISRYSPYQNLKPEQKYPRVLFTTSTRDDRVHPGHARKMVARMLALGYDPLYYENIEGGHGGAADNEQRAHLLALEYSYLWQQLAR